jgi:hypothetical protein
MESSLIPQQESILNDPITTYKKAKDEKSITSEEMGEET